MLTTESSIIDLFHLPILFSQYRSSDDTSSRFEPLIVMFIKKIARKHEKCPALKENTLLGIGKTKLTSKKGLLMLPSLNKVWLFLQSCFQSMDNTMHRIKSISTE